MKTTRPASIFAAAVVATVATGYVPSGAAPAAPAEPAQAPPITVAELPGLGGGSAIPLDVDPSGRVVGSSSTGGSTHPCLWDGGQVTDLAPTLPSGATGSAEGIAGNGRIVGFLSAALPGGGGPGVVTWLGGTMATVSAPPAAGDEVIDLNDGGQILYRDGGRSFLWSDGTRTAAPDVAPGVRLDLADVNEWGLAVGTSAPADPGDRRAHLWFPGLPPLALGTLGGSWSEALAVNDRGQVVGLSETAGGQRRMFITQGTSLVDLGTLGGDDVDAAVPPGLAPRLVNDLGHVVGISETATGEHHAFLWRDGHMTDLGTLAGARGQSSAFALNDHDQVVGYATGGDAALVDAFVWQDGRMVDLGRLTGIPDRLGSAAFVIDDHGRAIGQTVPTSAPGAGHTRAWLWTVSRSP